MSVGTQLTTGDAFFVSLCGGMTLDAREGGTIRIGDDSTQPETRVTVEAGSTLILGGGSEGSVLEREFLPDGPYVSKGKLIIHANSRLVIERGANLIINPGAEISLLGPNAVLEIRGNLHITQGGNFTYTSINGGYVRFDLPDNNGDPNVTMDYYTKITLEEVPFTIAFDSYLRPDDHPEVQFTIRQATGTFESDAYINVSQSLFTLTDSTILLGGGPSHKGIVINGAAHEIRDNTIYGGHPGISANNSVGGAVLTVHTTAFSGGKIGIQTVVLPVFVQGCSFSGAEKGIEATDALVSLNDVEFSTCDTGLLTTRGQVLIHDAEFTSCETGWYGAEFGQPASITDAKFLGGSVGVRVEGPSTVRAVRSTFRSNVYGIELAQGAILDIQNSAANVFHGNSSPIFFNEAGTPELAQGYNAFYKDTANPMAPTISGSIDNTVQCPVPGIPASMNTYYYFYNALTQTWTGTDLSSSMYNITALNGGCAYSLLP
jgi:hypothetical protein